VTSPGSGRIIVSNVSFALNAGSGLALLGASASGKSSLARALVGVWSAAGGVVRIDDAALDQWNADDLGRHIGYLPQDVALFDGTVAENIARFDESAGSEAILEAARIAGAHELILRLPNGYSTRIGEGGASLSAGQRQRIGLARAVFGNPFLVVLDEPNANLDAEGEKALSVAIAALRQRRCIVIVVSHRPSALAALDMAMVLSEGRIIAFGPREAALASLARAVVQRAPFGAAKPAAAKPGLSMAAGGARP
jgi:ABC-type protease/lipase transport system fused ATPase/permease subunit